jgi:hypothetical protein
MQQALGSEEEGAGAGAVEAVEAGAEQKQTEEELQHSVSKQTE